MDRDTKGWTEIPTPMSHPGKAGATKINNFNDTKLALHDINRLRNCLYFLNILNRKQSQGRELLFPY